MSTKKYITTSARETQDIAADFAKEILGQKPASGAIVMALNGNLGAGKTTFLQGFARGLGIAEVVNSPTFVIMKKFSVANAQFSAFYHIDCYRLENAHELEQLGLSRIIADPHNLVAIEWAENAAALLPEKVIAISLVHGGADVRELCISR